jgi:hypothetical protein
MERITPTNVGEKLNKTLRITDDERNTILFEIGCDYFSRYADGDEEMRRSITTGQSGKLLWSWFSNQFYMASSEFLSVMCNANCDTATRRRIFIEVVPEKINRFFPPYAMIKRFNKQEDEQNCGNNRAAACQIPDVAHQPGKQEQTAIHGSQQNIQ